MFYLKQINVITGAPSEGRAWSNCPRFPPLIRPWKEGQINHRANRTNARGLALLGASRLNIKTLLYWFFMC